MKLFAIRYSCSMAPQLALRDAGIPHELVWVDRATSKLEQGGDFRAINPKAKVPVLSLDDGSQLTENIAVLLHIAGGGSMRLHEWLSFVATELHKAVLGPFFDRESPDATKADVASRLMPVALAHVERSLTSRAFLLGDETSVADAYLFWTLVLAPQLGTDLSSYPALSRFRERMLARPNVRAVLREQRP